MFVQRQPAVAHSAQMGCRCRLARTRTGLQVLPVPLAGLCEVICRAQDHGVLTAFQKVGWGYTGGTEPQNKPPRGLEGQCRWGRPQLLSEPTRPGPAGPFPSPLPGKGPAASEMEFPLPPPSDGRPPLLRAPTPGEGPSLGLRRSLTFQDGEVDLWHREGGVRGGTRVTAAIAPRGGGLLALPGAVFFMLFFSPKGAKKSSHEHAEPGLHSLPRPEALAHLTGLLSRPERGGCVAWVLSEFWDPV